MASYAAKSWVRPEIDSAALSGQGMAPSRAFEARKVSTFSADLPLAAFARLISRTISFDCASSGPDPACAAGTCHASEATNNARPNATAVGSAMRRDGRVNCTFSPLDGKSLAAQGRSDDGPGPL